MDFLDRVLHELPYVMFEVKDSDKIVPEKSKKYSWQHINESKLLHMYVMNEFLAASCTRLTKYFWKTIYKDL